MARTHVCRYCGGEFDATQRRAFACQKKQCQLYRDRDTTMGRGQRLLAQRPHLERQIREWVEIHGRSITEFAATSGIGVDTLYAIRKILQLPPLTKAQRLKLAKVQRDRDGDPEEPDEAERAAIEARIAEIRATKTNGYYGRDLPYRQPKIYAFTTNRRHLVIRMVQGGS